MTFRFDAIAFDFDGVLVESVDIKTQAFAELYLPYGQRVVDAVVAYHLAHGGVSRYEKFRYFHEILLGQAIDDKVMRELAERFSVLVEDAVVAAPWVAGAYDFLCAQHEQFELSIVSGTPEAELQRIVQRRGADAFFRHIKGAPASKGDLLREIVLLGGYAPERVLMVGDALTDYDGAREAGVSFVGRVPSSARNPFPSGVGVIEDISHLRACLST